jgi:DNA-binding response OmpR family regulator
VGEILLIAAEWQLRALVRAQLLEEGYEVMALPSMEIGRAYLARSDQSPRLTIVDTQGLQLEVRHLVDLWQLSGQAPLILCARAPWQEELAAEGLPLAWMMLRPFRVGDLVKQVRRILVCPEGDITTKPITSE